MNDKHEAHKNIFFAVFEVLAVKFCWIALFKIVCAIQLLYPSTQLGRLRRKTSVSIHKMLINGPSSKQKNYARLSEADKAMECLEQSYNEHDCLLVLLKTLEWWDPLRSDARFQDLMRRVGIP